MGLPYPERGVNIINVILDAPTDAVNALVSRLNILPGVSVKTTFSPDEKEQIKFKKLRKRK